MTDSYSYISDLVHQGKFSFRELTNDEKEEALLFIYYDADDAEREEFIFDHKGAWEMYDLLGKAIRNGGEKDSAKNLLENMKEAVFASCEAKADELFEEAFSNRQYVDDLSREDRAYEIHMEKSLCTA